jgi:hypothetical protein
LVVILAMRSIARRRRGALPTKDLLLACGMAWYSQATIDKRRSFAHKPRSG